jgi:hypothetical protein
MPTVGCSVFVLPVINRSLHAALKAHSHRSLGQRPKKPQQR